jgi:hypothetical protein
VVARRGLVAAWVAPVVLLALVIVGARWVTSRAHPVDRSVYLELAPAGFTPAPIAVASGERVAFIVHNQSPQGCALSLGSDRGPVVGRGATATLTATIAGHGQVALRCGHGPEIAVAVP